ncbi:MAG: hypothetical protein ACM3ZB_03570 [bacterium]
MSHPSEGKLALFAGNDLHLWARMMVARHLRGCDECSRRVEEYRALRDFAQAEAGELPAGVCWDALAREMKANIRLGLAAGECVADPPRFASRWRTPAIVLPVLLVIVAGWVLATLPQLRHTRQAESAPPAHHADYVVLEAGHEGIGLEAEGRGFRLLQPGAENVVYTVRGETAVRARYVDSETGQVTISHVYAQ